jgi:predicted dehydrogenase
MVRVGVVGTSWWADSMYLPALKQHPQAEVAAVCGRDYQRLQEFAGRWNTITAT